MAAVIAALLVLAVVMVGCSKGDDFGAPGAPEELGNLPNFTGQKVTQASDAKALIEGAGLYNFISGLAGTDDTVISTKLAPAYTTILGGQTSASFDGDIEGADTFGSGKATFTGSISASMTLSKPISQLTGDTEGEQMSTSSSINATYTVSKTNRWSYYGTDVMGVVYVDASNNSTSTISKKSNDTLLISTKTDTSSDDTQIISVALTLDQGTSGFGAKITFSAAQKTDSSDSYRASSGSSSATYDISDILVYDNSGALLHTFDTDDVSIGFGYWSASQFADFDD